LVCGKNGAAKVSKEKSDPTPETPTKEKLFRKESKMVIREIISMTQQTFTIGDWIVHAFYGVGQVKGRENKVLEGEDREYLWIKTADSDYWLPIENMDATHIRPLASQDQIRKALNLIQKQPEALANEYLVRRKEISMAVNDVSLNTKACMIRDLSGRKRVHNLNLNEGEILLQMKLDLINEWALVTGEEKNILQTKLTQALQFSSKKPT
jgi:RNA polymerase-interacting CarD/CdnL/TRCF family regulator